MLTAVRMVAITTVGSTVITALLTAATSLVTRDSRSPRPVSSITRVGMRSARRTTLSRRSASSPAPREATE